jgi:hypothetical protein
MVIRAPSHSAFAAHALACTTITETGKFKVPTTTAPAVTEAEVFKQFAKEYELRATIIYASYFAYRMTGSKFDIIESSVLLLLIP